MIKALVGSNSFALRRRLDELVNTFVEKNGELALERFDGEEHEAQAILDGLFNLPFLAKQKIIVVRNGSLNKDFVDKLEHIISSIPEWCELILYEPNIDRRGSYFKLLKSHRLVEEFAELDSRGLANWLVTEAKKTGSELTLADALYLVERVGADQYLLFNELQKLTTYDKKISRANIELLVESTPQSKIFDLLDAAFSDRKKRALELYEDQRSQRIEPQEILAMLIWQLRGIALTKHGSNDSMQIAKDSGLSEYPLRKAAGLASKLIDDQVREMVEELYQMDLKSKTVAYDLDEAIKTYIATL